MELLVPFLILLPLLPISVVALLLSRRRRGRPAAEVPSAESSAPAPVEEKVEGGDVERKRKKKGRRRRGESAPLVAERGAGGEKEEAVLVAAKLADDGMYPFSSFSSATQRRIKHRYDELVRSNEAKVLTVSQVGQFINCLVEARNDLQQKSQIIQRKFTIAKALLIKADRPSFCRLCQQMLDIGARMEAEADSGQPVDAADTDFTDISFEELLAKEKKDSFWQKNGKLRSCTG